MCDHFFITIEIELIYVGKNITKYVYENREKKNNYWEGVREWAREGEGCLMLCGANICFRLYTK